jgi:peroxiredoxin
MRERFSGILPYVALAAAAVLVVVLAQQKRGLITQVNDLRRQVYEARSQPTRGAYLPSFQTTTLDGAPVTVGQLPAEGRQVLLVYTTTCQFCKRSLPAWKKLTAALDTMTQPRVQVYGLSLDSVDVTRKYAAEHALPYATVRFPDVKLESMYRAGSVPLTLVLDEQGRTIYSRLGEITRQETIDSVVTWVKWKPAPPPRDSAAAAQPRRTASR